MPDLALLLPFLAAVAVIELTPGPNMAYLALVSARSGVGHGLATVAGVTLGLAVYLAAAVLGLSEAALRWPIAYQTLRWAGVIYMLWLALDAWRGAAEAQAADKGYGRLFLRGLAVNLLNPKAALFYVAILPSFITAGAGSVAMQALALGSIHLAVSVGVHGAIVLTAGRAQGLMSVLAGSDGGRNVRRGFAIALAATAAWVAYATRG